MTSDNDENAVSESLKEESKDDIENQDTSLLKKNYYDKKIAQLEAEGTLLRAQMRELKLLISRGNSANKLEEGKRDDDYEEELVDESEGLKEEEKVRFGGESQGSENTPPPGETHPQERAKPMNFRQRIASVVMPGLRESVYITTQAGEDSYSFMFCAPPWSLSFFVGFITMALQFTLYGVFIVDLQRRVSPLLAVHVTETVRFSQAVCLFISFMSQENIFQAVRALVYQEGVHELKEHFEGFTKNKFLLVNLLMFILALFGYVVSIFLIITSDNLFDLVLNFTAMIFVSQLDDITFFLSSLGVLGRGPEAMSKSIKNFQFDQQVATYKKRCLMNLFLSTLLILGFGLYIWSFINQLENKGLDPVILVEFGDSQDPEIGIYSGCYELTADGPFQRVKYTMMKDPQYNTFESEFRYDASADESTWTFYKNKTDEESYLQSSSGDHVNSFDLMDSNSDVWVITETSTPLSYVKLIGIDDQTIIDEKCMRESESTTELRKEICPILFVDTSVEDLTVEWSEEYKFLTYLNESVVFYYQRPVYRGLHKGDFIFFTGRHWALTGRDIAKKIGNNNTFTEFLHNETLMENYESKNELIAYLSEANNGDTPLKLRWFRKIDKANFDFPAVDIANPISLFLKCGQCHDTTNPCEFGGKCNDGECDCKHGTEGALCGIMPLNNGICNEKFNYEKYEFDGGDCCASTCNNPLTCGITTSPKAFDKKALTGEFSIEFPQCVDTTMVPLEITLKSSVNQEILTEDTNFRKYEIKVVCNDKTKKERTHLLISMDPNITEKVSEIVHVPSHNDCNLTFQGVQNPRLYVLETNFDLKINVAIQDKLLNKTGDGVTLMSTRTIEDDAEIELPEVYNRCLLKYLLNDSNVLDASLLYNETNYQDRAVAWLNNEKYVIDGCQANKNWFIERYAIVALSQNTPLIKRNASDVTEATRYPWIQRNDPHCSWTGINCDNTSSKVEELIYVGVFNNWYANQNREAFEYFKQLRGQIVDEIRLLSNLEHLDLRNNEDNSDSRRTDIGLGDDQPFPTILGELTQLTLLSLHSNKFKGSIPSELGKLTKLEVLDLSKNKNNGKIPSELGKLTKLRKLSLVTDQGKSSSILTGTIPSELTALSNLTHFSIRLGEITGDFPTELQNVWTKKMEHFEVNEKDFLPMEWILKMTKLKHLTWGGIGKVPLDFNNADCGGDNISDLVVSNISDLVVSNISDLVEYNLSDLVEYNIFDSIEGNSSDLIEGNRSDLVEYNISDSIEVNSSDCEEGVNSDCEEDGYCYKDGNDQYFYKNVEKIPTDLGKLTELLHLELGSDRNADAYYLYGGIPTQLCSLTKLENLIMDYHDLSGSIPACFTNLKQLRELSLQAADKYWDEADPQLGAYPTLSGTIPAWLGKLSKLTKLGLEGNIFSGGIPTELGRLTALINLDLSKNQLSSIIPTELGNLNKLTTLTLRKNIFSGFIPTEFGNLVLLEDFYLNQNTLSGSIPTQIGRMTNLEFVEFQNNLLGDNIPTELGNLKGLQKLWLSNNELTGIIPTELGEMVKLESLKLKDNNLSGDFPKVLCSKPFNLYCPGGGNNNFTKPCSCDELR